MHNDAPRVRPETDEPSSTVSARLPIRLHAAVKAKGAAENRSFSGQLRADLEALYPAPTQATTAATS